MGKKKWEESNPPPKYTVVEDKIYLEKLVIDIINNSGAYPLTLKRSLLVGMPLDRVSASIALNATDSDALIIKERA